MHYVEEHGMPPSYQSTYLPAQNTMHISIGTSKRNPEPEPYKSLQQLGAVFKKMTFILHIVRELPTTSSLAINTVDADSGTISTEPVRCSRHERHVTLSVTKCGSQLLPGVRTSNTTHADDLICDRSTSEQQQPT